MQETLKTVLTGDRPSGPLHLGHYVGSLANRVKLQDTCNQYVLIADVQALAANYDDPKRVRANTEEVMLDYLAVGLTPAKTTFVLQSQIPEIAQLSVYFQNHVTLARLQRNPTIKEELQQKGFEKDIPVGFLTHPIHQAADIAIFNADLVPVGNDQLPLIEQAREIVRSFNRIYGRTLKEPEAMLSNVSRLVGIDGHAKMSKSLGNAIYLKSTQREVEQLVRKMYTDPQKLTVGAPGHLEGNVVFSYLDVFDKNTDELNDLKGRYTRGGVGDSEVKKRLVGVLENLINPIRARREQLGADRTSVIDVLQEGTKKARMVTAQTMAAVEQAMHIHF
jgi:tryptophanyl-tRNA synthetase